MDNQGITAQSDPAATTAHAPRAEVKPSGLFGSKARQKLLAFASLILLMIYFSFASPAFTQTDNMITILQAT
jgi:ribose transport system permease protein